VALFSGFAEIKRIYVRGGSRGQGVANAIVALLAAETVDAGLTALRLETGTRHSVLLEKRLRPGAP
jgi:putative acetyltransferase